MKLAAMLPDRASILEKGQIVYTGPMADLVANGEIRRAWLAL